MMTTQKKPLINPRDLPQTTDEWYFESAKARVWVTPKNRDPYRPFLIVCFDKSSATIVHSELVENLPDPDGVAKLLFKWMRKPMKTTANPQPHRPERIYFEDSHLQKSLIPVLNEVGIQSRYRPQPGLMQDLLIELGNSMNKGQPCVPALLSLEGVTPKIAGAFYSAAADFYRSAPWAWLGNSQPLAIWVGSQKEPDYGSLMGEGGVNFGIVFKRDIKNLKNIIYCNEHIAETELLKNGYRSVTFNEPIDIPFEDLDAVERYGWDVAAPNAFPLLLQVSPSLEFILSGREDLIWYEAVLLAIPQFVKSCLIPDGFGSYQPREEALRVQTSTGNMSVRIKYPGLNQKQMAYPPLTADVRNLIDAVRESAEIAIPKSLSTEWHNLDEALDLVYISENEEDLEKKVVLARSAIKLSRFCFDAYKVLAKFMATTLVEKMELYRVGVDTWDKYSDGEFLKADHQEYLKFMNEKIGFSPRPDYIFSLLDLRRKKDALEQFDIMMKQEPSDEYGIRYTFLETLIDLNRDEEAFNLLDKYADDFTPAWKYSLALLVYRREGATPRAEELLVDALERNRYVPAYVDGSKRVPEIIPMRMIVGGNDEAADFAAHFLMTWMRTPGAVAWMKDTLSKQPKIPNPLAKVRPGPHGKK